MSTLIQIASSGGGGGAAFPYTGDALITGSLNIRASGSTPTDNLLIVRDDLDTRNIIAINNAGTITSTAINSGFKWWVHFAGEQTSGNIAPVYLKTSYPFTSDFYLGKNNATTLLTLGEIDNASTSYGLVYRHAGEFTIRNAQLTGPYGVRLNADQNLTQTVGIDTARNDFGYGWSLRNFTTSTDYINFSPNNSFIGIGWNDKTSSLLGALVDIKAQGALSTDIALRVRDSANNIDIIKVTGNQETIIQSGWYSTYTFTNDANGAPTFIGKITLGTLFEIGNDYNVDFVNYSGALRLYNSGDTAIKTKIQAVGPSYFAHPTTALSIGTSTNAARLDIRSQGALSTDIAFRVRDSADTDNLIQGSGDGLWKFKTGGERIEVNTSSSDYKISSFKYDVEMTKISTYSSYFCYGSTNQFFGIGNNSPSHLLDVNKIGTQKFVAARIGNDYNSTIQSDVVLKFTTAYCGGAFGGNPLAYLTVGNNNTGATTNARTYFKFELLKDNTLDERASITSQSNLLLQTPTEDTNDIGVMYIPNGTAPTVSITNGFKQYSADIVPGNAAPHFLTEAGDVIKLYKQSAAGIATVGDLVTILTNLGLLA